MRNAIMALGAFSLAIPAAAVFPTSSVEAAPKRQYNHGNYRHHSCRHSKGTTGLVAGGVGGALVGRSVLGHGLLGTVAGGVGGALAGRAIDRTITAKKRCR